MTEFQLMASTCTCKLLLGSTVVSSSPPKPGCRLTAQAAPVELHPNCCLLLVESTKMEMNEDGSAPKLRHVQQSQG